MTDDDLTTKSDGSLRNAAVAEDAEGQTVGDIGDESHAQQETGPAALIPP